MPLISDKKLREQWEKHKHISEGSLDNQHAGARDDHAFHAGDTMAYTATVMEKKSRHTVVFNKVKPYIDAVVGFMVQLRRKPQYQARLFDNAQQQQFSQDMNSISDYARENANLDHLESRQDREMLITGYAAIDTNIIYELNPDGEVKAENIRYNDIFWDPQAVEPNLLDARWVFWRKKFNIDEALKRFKGSKKEDFDGVTDDHSNFHFNPRGGEFTAIAVGTGGTEEDLIEVYYYQWWELQTFYRAQNPLFELTDPVTVNSLGQIMEQMRVNRIDEAGEDQVEDYFEFDPFAEFLVMTPQIKADMQALFKRFNVDVDYQRHEKKIFYTSVLSSKKIFLKFKSPEQQGFTVKFKTGDYDPINKRWYGMVAALKEPARYANKALTEILYVIASNSKGGVMYEKSAVLNVARFEQQWATTKAAIQVADGALMQGKIQPKATASLPSGYDNIYTIANNSLGEVTGINREFLGNSQSSQVSGLLEAQRIDQVVNTLASYFDGISLYQKEHARMMITFIRILAQNSSGRLVKIIGEDGAVSFKALSEDRLAEEYDVDIGEAPISARQKQETTLTMIQIADKLLSVGQNIYPVAVQYLPIKQADKRKLIEILTPPEPDPAQAAAQQQEQQAIQQIALEGQKARIAKDVADTQLKVAQIPNTEAEADETLTRTNNIEANTLRTLAEANQKNIESKIIQKSTDPDVNIII